MKITHETAPTARSRRRAPARHRRAARPTGAMPPPPWLLPAMAALLALLTGLIWAMVVGPFG